jgi:hypothetical protein
VSATEQVVELLGSLGESDRRWILDHLPPDARARLVDHVDEAHDADSGASPEFEWTSVVARLTDVNAEALTRALEHEPAWLVSAVLNAADWPWRHDVLRGFRHRCAPSWAVSIASAARSRDLRLNSYCASWQRVRGIGRRRPRVVPVCARCSAACVSGDLSDPARRRAVGEASRPGFPGRGPHRFGATARGRAVEIGGRQCADARGSGA